MIPFPTDEARWQAVVARDPTADGAFLYGVVTTGIYCRPTCASRLPNRENVRFFDCATEAEDAGLRACKRCEPDKTASPDPHREAVVRACQMIDESDTPPTLSELAASAGLSPSYFQRVFKRHVGLTPKQYALAVRANRMREALRDEPTVTEAIYASGYGSSSRFYENIDDSLGMQPLQFRQGGADAQIRYASARCYLGWVLVASTERGVCAITFGDAPAALEAGLRDRFPRASLLQADPRLEEWLSRILAYLDTPAQSLNLPLDIQGTAFQQRVWSALQAIPAGSTASYAQIAEQIGQPTAARAVARACASNKVAVAVPCHRAVRSDGGLGGYRWGLERKRQLLDREAGA